MRAKNCDAGDTVFVSLSCSYFISPTLYRLRSRSYTLAAPAILFQGFLAFVPYFENRLTCRGRRYYLSSMGGPSLPPPPPILAFLPFFCGLFVKYQLVLWLYLLSFALLSAGLLPLSYKFPLALCSVSKALAKPGQSIGRSPAANYKVALQFYRQAKKIRLY